MITTFSRNSEEKNDEEELEDDEYLQELQLRKRAE